MNVAATPVIFCTVISGVPVKPPAVPVALPEVPLQLPVTLPVTSPVTLPTKLDAVATPITFNCVALIKSVAPVPVKEDPSPENNVAVIVPSTSNFVSGIVLPIPTLPLLLIPVRVFLFHKLAKFLALDI